VSYDEDGGSRQGNYNSRGRGGYGGRGGGRGGGGRGGYEQRPRRVLSPEAAAVNEALAASTSWRQLNTVLEQQVRRQHCHAGQRQTYMEPGYRLSQTDFHVMHPQLMQRLVCWSQG
jgi:hypothetical protein